jgi:hypothetical protein
MAVDGVFSGWWNPGMTDREIWEQLAGVMGMILEAEEAQVALARNIHSRLELVEKRMALLAGQLVETLPEAPLIEEHRRILAQQESRHERYGAVLAELRSAIERLH